MMYVARRQDVRRSPIGRHRVTVAVSQCTEDGRFALHIAAGYFKRIKGELKRFHK